MSFFKTPKPAMPAPLAPIPERTDEETAALAEVQRKKFATSGEGRASTYLTQSGTSSDFSAVRYLGGAGRT